MNAYKHTLFLQTQITSILLGQIEIKRNRYELACSFIFVRLKLQAQDSDRGISARRTNETITALRYLFHNQKLSLHTGDTRAKRNACEFLAKRFMHVNLLTTLGPQDNQMFGF